MVNNQLISFQNNSIKNVKKEIGASYKHQQFINEYYSKYFNDYYIIHADKKRGIVFVRKSECNAIYNINIDCFDVKDIIIKLDEFNINDNNNYIAKHGVSDVEKLYD